MTVWDDLVGQHRAVETLRAARRPRDEPRVAVHRPARLRALQRRGRLRGGAGVRAEGPDAGLRQCHECHTVLAGTHADVTVVRTEKLSHRRRRGARPGPPRRAGARSGARWQVIIVEDADRLTEQACNALLKAIEEPTDRTVWMLCAPTVEDVLPTIRSRCRLVTLTTPDDRGRRGLPGPRRRRRPRRSRRTPPAPARATSAGPGRWPATRAPATAAARSSAYPAKLTAWAPA